MKKLFLTLAAVTFISTPAYANHGGDHAALKNIVIEVNGLVCDFCARAVEKVFYKQDGVESVDVNLDEHAVTVGLAEGYDLTDEQITTFITDAGYNLVNIKRADEAE